MFKKFRQAWKIAKEMDEVKEVTPMSVLPSYKSNKAVYKDWSTENAVRYGYKASTWVYSCISRISKTAASVPWKVYRETEKGLEEIPNHPLEILLKRPNPYMSGQDIFERLVSHLYLGGNTILSKVRANNIVAELWPLSPDLISPVPTQQEFISGYEYKKDGVTQFIEASEIIHVMFVDPSNPYWGVSPLQAVARVVDTDAELVNFQMISLQNRAITDGVFSFKQPLTKQQWEEAREQVREQHMGVNNIRTPWVLGGDASWQQMSLSPAELDFISSRNFTREEIASVFNVPPPMIGLYDNATLSNIETARKIFWLDTMIPLLEDLKSSFNISLTPEFGEGLVLSYDVSNVQALQENFTEKVNTAKNLWSMGIPFNMVNQRLELGFDEIEGGEIGYVPHNLILSGTVPSGNVDVNVDNEGTLNNNYRPSHKKAWNLETEEQKELYWKDLDSRRNGWIKQFSKRIEALFEEEAELVAEAFEESGAEGVFDVIDSREDQWKQLTSAMYFAIIEDFGEQTWNNLKSQKAPLKKAFDPWDAIIQKWVRSRAAEKIVGVLDTTKDLVRNVIALAQEEGVGVDKIATRIKERYQGFSRRRAEVIARTETVASSNYGSMMSAKQTGLDPKKVWISSRDERVRDSHENVDGTIIDIDEKFSVGKDSMMAPGLGKVAEENVNCRCALSYRVQR